MTFPTNGARGRNGQAAAAASLRAAPISALADVIRHKLDHTLCRDVERDPLRANW
jgi:hypothetical protein